MKATHLYSLLVLLLVSCGEKSTFPAPFEMLDPDTSGIAFSNNLIDSDSFNIMQYLYYYNGGGVAAGDLNNDGWVDLYFTGNQVDDALYINAGDLSFKDISTKSGINGHKGWSTGVTLLDINEDGWLDIYVCRLGKYKMYNDHNRLYINNQDETFTESAAAYGLEFSGFSTQSAFFDYDGDGIPDCLDFDSDDDGCPDVTEAEFANDDNDNFLGTGVPTVDGDGRVTGFGGATNVAESGSDVILDETIKVRFDASLSRDMPWTFKPEVREMEIRIGETGLAFYEAHNPLDVPIAGQASYNVTPYEAGAFFDKTECFCFTEQVLMPGETVLMPVSFFVEPEIVEDRDAKHVPVITLSYTFHVTDLPEDYSEEQAATDLETKTNARGNL